jgi:hypothetical protein
MIMTIGLLVWGMQAKIIYGGYCKRSYVSRPQSNGKMERDNKVMYSFQSWNSRPSPSNEGIHSYCITRLYYQI